ncbi:hypothetical protein BN1723_016124 [Verticillium longisporum]|uniref:CENP-V/GFA domain-containing protein n=1 Tax=Verticillium longisporum TaxID=100787 RepID=A0A0G4N9Q2_VERLO|nr:hypothetical protein BN1723_016124 [Verticillium longisporum]
MSFPLHPSLVNGITKGDPSFQGGVLKCKCSTSPVTVTLRSNVVHNHACGCSKCWKPEGALFSIVSAVPVDKLEVTANGDKLAVVDPSATILRHACTGCGVHLYGHRSQAYRQGFDARHIDDVRAQLKSLGLESYDALNPPLMDAIAAFTAANEAKA